MSSLVGDCLLAASFLSYMGPFLSHYREELLNIWMTQVRDDTHIHAHTTLKVPPHREQGDTIKRRKYTNNSPAKR